MAPLAENNIFDTLLPHAMCKSAWLGSIQNPREMGIVPCSQFIGLVSPPPGSPPMLALPPPLTLTPPRPSVQAEQAFNTDSGVDIDARVRQLASSALCNATSLGSKEAQLQKTATEIDSFSVDTRGFLQPCKVTNDELSVCVFHPMLIHRGSPDHVSREANENNTKGRSCKTQSIAEPDPSASLLEKIKKADIGQHAYTGGCAAPTGNKLSTITARPDGTYCPTSNATDWIGIVRGKPIFKAGEFQQALHAALDPQPGSSSSKTRSAGEGGGGEAIQKQTGTKKKRCAENPDEGVGTGKVKRQTSDKKLAATPREGSKKKK